MLQDVASLMQAAMLQRHNATEFGRQGCTIVLQQASGHPVPLDSNRTSWVHGIGGTLVRVQRSLPAFLNILTGTGQPACILCKARKHTSFPAPTISRSHHLIVP